MEQIKQGKGYDFDLSADHCDRQLGIVVVEVEMPAELAGKMEALRGTGEKKREVSTTMAKEEVAPKQVDNKKVLDAVRRKVNDKYKKNYKTDDDIVYTGAQIRDILKPRFMSIGIDSVDEALGGGIPERVATTVWGPPGCGKTSFALMAVVAAQKRGEICMWVDAEGEFPYAMALLLGVDIDALEIIFPKDYGEQILDVLDEYLFDGDTKSSRGAVGLIVIDSINGLLPKDVVNQTDDKGNEGKTVGRRAAMLSAWLEKVAGRGMLRAGTKLICIAQERIDVNNQGLPKMSGGKALEFLSKVIGRLGRRSFDDSKLRSTGHNVHISWTKNSVKGMPGESIYPVMYGVGVDDSTDVLQRAMNAELITKQGRSDYVIHLPDGDQVVGGGINALRALMQTDRKLKEKVKEMLPEKKLKNFNMEVQEDQEESDD